MFLQIPDAYLDMALVYLDTSAAAFDGEKLDVVSLRWG